MMMANTINVLTMASVEMLKLTSTVESNNLRNIIVNSLDSSVPSTIPTATAPMPIIIFS
ncbi:hypothetical protein D3C86_2207800 [compost metagenome]